MAGFLDRVKNLTQKKGGKDKEIEKYEKILTDQPEDRNALNALGDLYAKRAEADKACEYYLKVGSLYARDGFTLKAIAVYKKAQRAKPDFIQTYLDLADLYVQKGLIGEAKSNYLTAGEMQAAAGQKHESLDTYRKIADLDPDNIKIRTKLAAMYENENYNDDAATIYVEIGKVVARDKPQDGKQYFKRARELQTDNEDVLSEIGYSYLDFGMRQEAAEIFRTLSDLFPDNVDYQEQVEELSGPAASAPAAPAPAAPAPAAPAPAAPAPAAPPAREPQTPPEEVSIEFSEEELTSLNFGDEPDEEIAPVEDLSSQAGSADDHSLDFQIENQGGIAFEDESAPPDEAPQADNTIDFSLGEPEPGISVEDTASQTGGDFYDLADKVGMSSAKAQQVGAGPSALKVQAHEELAKSDISDIVGEFKKGVMEEVGTEDYETHYELGISYKEMDLLDDAIEELKLASLEPSIFVDCQSVMALCYAEKGELDLAAQSLQEARARVEKGSGKYQDLSYQLGDTYEKQDNVYEAVQVYQELFQVNPNYRDVKRKLNKLLG